MNSFRRLHPGTPLEGRDGMFIIEDRKKWLWMGTSDGLFHYDKNDNFIPYNFVERYSEFHFYPMPAGL